MSSFQDRIVHTGLYNRQSILAFYIATKLYSWRETSSGLNYHIAPNGELVIKKEGYFTEVQKKAGLAQYALPIKDWIAKTTKEHPNLGDRDWDIEIEISTEPRPTIRDQIYHYGIEDEPSRIDNQFINKRIITKASVKLMKMLYDFLRGRPTKYLIDTYGAEYVDRMIGVPNDPFTTQAIQVKYEAMTNEYRLLEQYQQVKVSEMNAKVDAIHKEYDAIKDKAIAKTLERLNEVEANFNEILKKAI